MTWTPTATGTGAVTVLTVLTVLLVAVLATPAAAANNPHHHRDAPPGHARFEGRTIDLKRGWGDAQACVVWRHDHDTECFRTEQAADAAVARRDRAEARPATTATSSWSLPTLSALRWTGGAPAWIQLVSSCGDWLTLYEHPGFGGRSLRFRDRGSYQDLANWGFANQTSSYQVGGCATTLRDGGWTLYPGSTGAYASAWSMASGWDNRVRYLRIS